MAPSIGQHTNTIAKKTCRLWGDKDIDEFSYIVQSLEASILQGLLQGAAVVYSLEYRPVVHDVAGSILANLMDDEWKTMSA